MWTWDYSTYLKSLKRPCILPELESYWRIPLLWMCYAFHLFSVLKSNNWCYILIQLTLNADSKCCKLLELSTPLDWKMTKKCVCGYYWPVAHGWLVLQATKLHPNTLLITGSRRILVSSKEKNWIWICRRCWPSTETVLAFHSYHFIRILE